MASSGTQFVGRARVTESETRVHATDKGTSMAGDSRISVSVLILSYNEEKHIARAIESVRSFARQIVVVDSYSTDRTVEIARSCDAEVLQNRWEQNYARQFNWGLDHAPITGQWVLRLDADEYVTAELAAEIKERIPGLPSDATGIYVRRRIHLLGRWMRRGATYPLWVLRLWRTGMGRCENRWMDEHIQLSGGMGVRFAHDIVDDNLNDLTWWTAKHNHYAVREAADLLNMKYRFMAVDGHERLEAGEQSTLKRWLKEHVYRRFPLFVRPSLYFLYRYIVRLGFLDGSKGLIWNVLQGFWYRFLVDAKVYEAEQKAQGDPAIIARIVREEWGLK